jgi:hypothetical protein
MQLTTSFRMAGPPRLGKRKVYTTTHIAADYRYGPGHRASVRTQEKSAIRASPPDKTCSVALSASLTTAQFVKIIQAVYPFALQQLFFRILLSELRNKIYSASTYVNLCIAMRIGAS